MSETSARLKLDRKDRALECLVDKGMDRFDFSAMVLAYTGEAYKSCSNDDEGDVFMTMVSTEFSCLRSMLSAFSGSKDIRFFSLPGCT